MQLVATEEKAEMQPSPMQETRPDVHVGSESDRYASFTCTYQVKTQHMGDK